MLALAFALSVAAFGALSAPGAPRISAAVSNATTASSDWTTYFAGDDRSGFAGNEGALNVTSASSLHLAWKASDSGSSGVDHGVFSQPIVLNQVVYWGSFDGYERATDTTGHLLWQTFLGHTVAPDCVNPSTAGVASTATVTSDVQVGTATSVLYVGGGDSKVYALNAATGAVLWSHSVGLNPDYFVWSSPAVYNNSVYIGVASFGDCPLVQGQLLQLNRVTGAVQHTFNVVPNGCTGGGVWGSPTIDAVAGTVYFDTGNNGDCTSTEPLSASIVEVNASDLSQVGAWSVPPAQQNTDSDFGSTPTLFSGVIGGHSESLVGAINKNGIFYAFGRGALASGPVWETPIAIGGADPTDGAGDVGSAAFDGTALYVVGDATTSGCTGTVNSLNPSTGAFNWQHCYTDGGFALAGVTADSGGVVAVGEGNNIAVLSAANGASVFTYAGTGPFLGPPSIAEGTLFEGDMAGNLYALTPSNLAPTTAVTIPSNGATQSGTAALVGAAASAGVSSVTFEISGGTLSHHVIATGRATLYGWLAQWNTTSVPNGTYTLQSVASYPGGVSGTSPGITITVNTPPPTTAVTIPSNGATQSGTAALVGAAASAGVSSVTFEISGGTLSHHVIATGRATLYGWLAQWNTTSVPNGTYTLQSVASYPGGVSGTSPGITITVNTPPPTTAVTIPSNGATQSGTAALVGAAASAGVSSVTFEISGGTLSHHVIATGRATLYGWLAQWNTTSVPNGTYTLQSVASYPGGVSGTSPGITITVAH